jgi:tetratricopeptide (TPR) repeat protein
MTTHVTIAHICGPLGQALAVVDGKAWLYEAKERRRPPSNDVRFFFEHGLEVRAVDPTEDGELTEDNLTSILDLEERRFQALQGLLIGMDSELDDNFRHRGLQRTDRLLADRTVADFIERRFLKPVQQPAWDLSGALRLARAEALFAVERLYEIISDPLLHKMEDAIADWGSHRGLSSVERAIALNGAYATGLLATLAIAIHDGDQRKVGAKLLFAKDVDWDRHLAAYLVNRFAKTNSDPQLPPEDEDDISNATEADIVAEVQGNLIQALDKYKSRHRRKGYRNRAKQAGAEGLDPILRQVEWIATRFETGHLHAGWTDVAELVKRQLADSGADNLAKSLTNLATRLAPQREVASALCDLAAMCAPEDPAVWTARAELLRKWGQTNEALAAYDRAVEDFPHEVVARNGRAETLRALGRLDEALAAYDRAVEDFPHDVVARNGRAETLRALGRLDEALSALGAAMGDYPFSKFIRNSYVVVLCELGRFKEARIVLTGVDAAPRTKDDWVAVHILCMVDLKEAPTDALATRLEELLATCPYRDQQLYFETALVVARIAVKRTSEARNALTALVARPALDVGEWAAIQLMEAHAEAAEGDLAAARRSVAAASNIVPHEQFRLRRLRQELERRFGLGSAPALTRSDEIIASERTLVRLEMDFWVECATRTSTSIP